jgi:lipoprotein-releasing system permease protein
MSVFNGLENLVGSLNASASSDLLIEAKAKYIDLTQFPSEDIARIDGVEYQVKILQDNVLFKYTPALEEDNPREFIGELKGVDANFAQATQIESMMVEGLFKLQNNGLELAILGNGVASRLQIHLNDYDNPIHCYFPKSEAAVSINPLDAINIENIFPAGVFSIQQEIDDKMVIASLLFAQKLMGLENKITSVQISLNDQSKLPKVQSEIQQLLGDKYFVKNRKEQNEVMYNIMKSEKWSSFLILAFILFIATFNLVGALSVLIIDKQADINNLSFMGANKQLIAKVFLIEGFLVTSVGTLLGLFLGIMLVLAQHQFALIPMQGSFVVEAFPVQLRLEDVLTILLVVIIVSMIAVVFPIKRLSNTLLKNPK